MRRRMLGRRAVAPQLLPAGADREVAPRSVVEERWRDEAGVDGFNISAAVRPADFERFAEFVTPELRRRGLLPGAGDLPTGLTLRETLTGAGPQLPTDHKGAGFRRTAELLA